MATHKFKTKTTFARVTSADVTYHIEPSGLIGVSAYDPEIDGPEDSITYFKGNKQKVQPITPESPVTATILNDMLNTLTFHGSGVILSKDELISRLQALGVPKKAQLKTHIEYCKLTPFEGITLRPGNSWLLDTSIPPLGLFFKPCDLSDIEVFKTEEPEQVTALYQRLHEIGLKLLDAPTSGGSGAGFVACDTETFDPLITGGPRGLDMVRGKIRLIQLYIPAENIKLVIDLGGRGSNHVPAGLGRKLTLLFQQSRGVIFHNALFDMGFLTWQLGVKFDYRINVLDTRVLSQNLWAGIKQFKHSLEAVAARFGITMDKYLQKSDFGAALIPAQIKYGVMDTVVTWQVFLKLSSALRSSVASNLEAAKTDCAFLTALNQMRVRGFPVDAARIEETTRATEEYLELKSRQFEETVGCEFSKRDQVLAYLQAEFGEDLFPDLQKATLNRNAQFPIVQTLLDCKFAAIRIPYSKRLASSTINGTVRGGFNPLATQGMGRTSCGTTDGLFVQLQNPAKESKDYPEVPDVRRCFVAGFNKKRGIKRKMAVVDLCLDAATTKVPVVGRGIIPITDVCVGDEVYGYKEGKIVTTKVYDTVGYDYSGDMYQWKGNYITQFMTKGHRIVFAAL